nr:putative dolichyl pyrophosphate man9glcnac2 alpha-1,3-glucosyltransferase [Quercus suber]
MHQELSYYFICIRRLKKNTKLSHCKKESKFETWLPTPGIPKIIKKKQEFWRALLWTKAGESKRDGEDKGEEGGERQGGNPPKYGDFEAQRHWMEITLNLPVKEWYRNSTTNDISYWGLDYPPLTAYQSYFHGLFLRFFHPESVSLFTSRGHESYLGKLLMRWTVLSSDALVFFPAVFYFVLAYHSGRSNGHKTHIAWHIAMILLSPCLMLIDHGHFQYNCISLGLTVGAVAAVLSNKELVACFLFSLALNHKQMTAYFAPAFFSHLLGKSLRCRNPILEVLKLGLVVLGTFALVWWPYLHSMEAFSRVLSRLAPFERGIYEDYVANFWCTTSVLVKWKRIFTMQSLKLLSLGATVSTCLPSMVQQIWAPSNQGFLYGLLNSAFSFYMFSFQVHEKSILLPLLPASLLALEEPFLLKWITLYALFSMFPLLCRDKLILPYIAVSALFVLIYYVPSGRQDRKYLIGLCYSRDIEMEAANLCKALNGFEILKVDNVSNWSHVSILPYAQYMYWSIYGRNSEVYR